MKENIASKTTQPAKQFNGVSEVPNPNSARVGTTAQILSFWEVAWAP